MILCQSLPVSGKLKKCGEQQECSPKGMELIGKTGVIILFDGRRRGRNIVTKKNLKNPGKALDKSKKKCSNRPPKN
jgi:hypothetical protein